MIAIRDKSKCCACLACLNVCPQNAIYTYEDKYGFVFPKVDESLCIHCGLCDAVCILDKENRKSSAPVCAYLMYHNRDDVLQSSSSGGAFTALSDVVLSMGGCVIGAMMDRDLNVKHTVAENSKERDMMRGSKYVQSDIGHVFREGKKLLDNGKTVMFVGTPCQVDGFSSYLGKEYKSLTTVELLCHGVPSNSFFKKHIESCERKYDKKAIRVSFRDKQFGWSPQEIEEVEFADGSKISNKMVQSYMKFFHMNASIRKSCLRCQYRKKQRVADLTIGDFWGAEKTGVAYNSKGSSVVFVNTLKGLEIVQKINDSTLVDVDLELAEKRISTKLPSVKCDLDEFWKCYLNDGYDALIKKYTDPSLKGSIHFFIKKRKRMSE